MNDQAIGNPGADFHDFELTLDSPPVGVSQAPAAPQPQFLTVPPLPTPPRPKIFIPQPISPALAPPTPRPALTPGRDLMWCLPMYKTTNPHTFFSVIALFNRASAGLTVLAGDAMVAHTRNKLAARFLASSFEWSLWVDDDMILPMGDPAWFKSVTGFKDLPDEFAAIKTVDRLRASGKTLIGATYFGRNPEGKPMFSEGLNDPGVAEELRQGPRNEIRATKWIGTGCLLVHRSVFESIQAKFPELAPPTPGDVWQFFSPSQDALFRSLDRLKTLTDPALLTTAVDETLAVAHRYHVGTGEDVIFSSRALAAGHQPYVDLAVVAGHIGACAYGPYNTGP